MNSYITSKQGEKQGSARTVLKPYNREGGPLIKIEAAPCYIVQTEAMVRGSNKCQHSEAIQELRELIYKEYFAIQMRQLLALGWGEVHGDLLWAPFCQEQARIVKVFICIECRACGRNGLCTMCSKKGVKHYSFSPLIDVSITTKFFSKFGERRRLPKDVFGRTLLIIVYSTKTRTRMKSSRGFKLFLFGAGGMKPHCLYFYKRLINITSV